jgi:hypothetical protein
MKVSNSGHSPGAYSFDLGEGSFYLLEMVSGRTYRRVDIGKDPSFAFLDAPRYSLRML